MTDAEILEAWRVARQAHEAATGANYGQALFRKLAAEEVAIERFGLGEHRKAYDVRFGRQNEQ